MRTLGIDFGDRHIGLALSDSLKLTAQPLGTYQPKSKKTEDRDYFLDLVRTRQIDEIVVGFPLRMDGTPGSRVEKTRAFAKWLEAAVRVPIIFWDERLTTHQAIQAAHEQKIRLKTRKSAINQISAAIILQSYLDSRRSDARGH